jgi:hypothetical protein
MVGRVRADVAAAAAPADQGRAGGIGAVVVGSGAARTRLVPPVFQV